METQAAIRALSALAQEHRLAVFRLLMAAGPAGLAAGAVARQLGVLPNTLSTHLALLEAAGLIGSRREGRSIIYTADFAGTGRLLDFLVVDCCSGRPEICAALIPAAPPCKAS